MAQNKHEELVRQIAEEMARQNEPAHFKIIDLMKSEEEIERASRRYFDLARIAVKYMAEIFEEGFYIDPGESDFPTLWLASLQKDRGLSGLFYVRKIM